MLAERGNPTFIKIPNIVTRSFKNQGLKAEIDSINLHITPKTQIAVARLSLKHE
jgi:hypothetical protein